MDRGKINARNRRNFERYTTINRREMLLANRRREQMARARARARTRQNCREIFGSLLRSRSLSLSLSISL